MKKARRRLTLDLEHERAIHDLCNWADIAIAALRKHEGSCPIALELERRWRTVTNQVMP